ncbi:MAG TPA: DUF4870 domain-containing protein [Steroidobacteraceae bacterium]|jgi:hypothetical protein
MNLADSVTESTGMPTQDERTWGMVAHLAALAFFIFPFGNILGPLIVYLAKRDQSAFVAAHAREALNFNITVALGGLLSCLLLLLFIGVLFAALILLFWLVMTIVAALKANEGLPYRYPFTLRLVT